VIVIDNSLGSLAASDPHQVPQEPGGQLPWLQGELAAARQAGRPAIVVGHRGLDSRLGGPAANTAQDADLVAGVLRDGGASAYFHDLPEAARASAIPAGGGERQVPHFGLGTLGYQAGSLDPRFAIAGLGLAEVDVAARNPSTNQAPVRVRLLPLIEELAIEAVDGVLLRRSQPGLFRGLGRRPRGGRRIMPTPDGPVDDDGSPYVQVPSEPCAIASPCPGRMEPEYRFTSSDPDIANFVRRDPASDNQRKPLLGPNDKPIADASSNLLCAFNAGDTTVTVESGGLRSSTRVTVLAGSVQRPCGTVPLNPSRFARRPARTRSSDPPEAPAAPPQEAPGETPEVTFDPPQLPPESTPAPVEQPPAPAPEPSPTPVPPIVPAVAAVVPPRVAIFPPAPSAARPAPPTGQSQVPASSPIVQTATAPKREEEEDAAFEESQAFTRMDHDADRLVVRGGLVAAVVLLALGGAAIRRAPRARGRRRTVLAEVRSTPPPRRRS
jgi:hypothetical protein